MLEEDSRLIADFLPTLRGTQEAFQQMQMYMHLWVRETAYGKAETPNAT